MIQFGPQTALLVVDVQNDFADPSGSLSVDGGAAIVGPLNTLIVRAAVAGAFIVYTQDWHPESTPHFEKDGGIWPVHCVAETWGAAFHPQLLIAGPTVRKGSNGEDGYSGFTMRVSETGESMPTEMAELLASRSTEKVVVTGLALDYCVGATAEDAVAAGLSVSLPLAYSAPVELQPGDGQAMIDRLTGLGVAVI